MRILIADDCGVNRMVLKAFIGKAIGTVGHTIDEVVNGVEAVEAYEKQRYDIVFMDLMMPVMDGLEASECITKKDKEALIVMVTAHGDTNGMQSKMGKAGVAGCIDKPVRGNKLDIWFEMVKQLNAKESI